MTPLERVERLYRDLTRHYRGGRDAELRAAAKLLLVAIAAMRHHGGPTWHHLVDDYVRIARHDPKRFERIMEASRTAPKKADSDDSLLC